MQASNFILFMADPSEDEELPPDIEVNMDFVPPVGMEVYISHPVSHTYVVSQHEYVLDQREDGWFMTCTVYVKKARRWSGDKPTEVP